MPRSGQFNDKINFSNKKNTKLRSYQGYNKIIIICIDRDDDIGIKCEVETPVIGKDLCSEAGLKLAIEIQ